MSPRKDDKSKIRDLLSEGRSAEEVESLARRNGWYSSSSRSRRKRDKNLLADLADMLWDADAEVRGRAAMVLCWSATVYPDFWKGVEERAEERLLVMLKDSDPRVRREVALAVVSAPTQKAEGVSIAPPQLIEKTIPSLIDLLDDGDPEVERAAGWSLGNRAVDWVLRHRGDYQTALDIQSKLADHKDAANRAQAAGYWAWNAQVFPEAAMKARPLLLKLAGDADDKVRELAEQALSSLG